MKLPPLLSEHPRWLQLLLAVVLPALYGGLTGYFLGISEPVYLVLGIIGILGAVGAGFDHLGARAGAKRGVIAGSVFGGSILIVHELHGAEAEAHLPEPAIMLVAVTTGIAIAFAALGGRLRERVARGGGPTAKSEPPGFIAAAPAGEPLARIDRVAEQPETGRETHGTRLVARPERTADGDGGLPVSLNSGSIEQYRALGMSRTQAKRVIAHREQLNGYSSVDELDSIPGFSIALRAELKQRLTV